MQEYLESVCVDGGGPVTLKFTKVKILLKNESKYKIFPSIQSNTVHHQQH